MHRLAIEDLRPAIMVIEVDRLRLREAAACWADSLCRTGCRLLSSDMRDGRKINQARGEDSTGK